MTLQEAEEVSLLQKLKHDKTRRRTLRAKHMTKAIHNVLIKTSVKETVSQVNHTRTFHQQVTHSTRNQTFITV